MKKILFLQIALFISIVSFGQTATDLLQKADSAYFDYKDYQSALALYKGLAGKLKPSDENYGYAIDKVARTLFYLQHEKQQDHNKSILFSKQFVEFASKYGKYINPEILDKKYFMFKNIIVAYFGLKQRNLAKPFQDTLYLAYKNGLLPKGINRYYCFESFVHKDQNIWGYEAFPQLGDKEAEGSFSKHIYYVYSRDSAGGDKEELYTLETVKIHKATQEGPDFVLTKRTRTSGRERSESIWSSTFSSPVDYEKLHNAVIEFLNGNVRPDTKTEIQLKQ